MLWGSSFFFESHVFLSRIFGDKTTNNTLHIKFHLMNSIASAKVLQKNKKKSMYKRGFKFTYKRKQISDSQAHLLTPCHFRFLGPASGRFQFDKSSGTFPFCIRSLEKVGRRRKRGKSILMICSDVINKPFYEHTAEIIISSNSSYDRMMVGFATHRPDYFQ